jgi:hypothetical protein
VAGCEEIGDLLPVFVGGSAGPEQLTHLCDLIRIVELCWPDFEIWHWSWLLSDQAVRRWRFEGAEKAD